MLNYVTMSHIAEVGMAVLVAATLLVSLLSAFEWWWKNKKQMEKVEVTNPRIAYCITCKGRANHIKKTLRANLDAEAGYDNAVFVLLNYNSQDDLMEYLAQEHRADINSGRLVVYTHPDAHKFHMAHAKNMAHRLGILNGADILVNLDADNLTVLDLTQPPAMSFSQYIANNFTYHNDVFMWAVMIKGVTPRGVSGRIVVTKDAFLKVGGYDERFNTWARDDKDFGERLERLGYAGLRIDTQYLGGYNHNDKIRFRDYPYIKATAYKYEEPCDTNASDVIIVNYGKVGCGLVTTPFAPQFHHIHLHPIATRIFGIGLHKTGTGSLWEALRLLGFSAEHWKEAKWAKAIWNEMLNEGRSITLEHYYGLTDLPIPVLYKELDEAYPGSKFILTIRPEEEWIASVEAHYSDANPYRKTWRKDRFSAIIHTALYGRSDFDRETMLARYREHNQAVIDYFADKPHQLLVMYDQRWSALCQFLGQPVPCVPYPHLNQSPKTLTS